MSFNYEERLYRDKTQGHELIEQTLIQNESDLQIYSNVPLVDKAEQVLKKIRQDLQSYIKKHPAFETSLEPLETKKDAPEIVRRMAQASSKANVGPMAAVAGAVSEYVGKTLEASCQGVTDIFIENGGDIYLNSAVERRILVHAGQSVLNEKIALKIKPEMTPCGICTSSGTVGHSLSYGNADAVVVISKNTLLADATATSIGNLVKSANEIETAINFGKEIKGIDGILIIVGEKIGAWGQIELC